MRFFPIWKFRGDIGEKKSVGVYYAKRVSLCKLQTNYYSYQTLGIHWV